MGAGIQIKLEPFGFEKAEAAITRIILASGTLKPVMEIAGKYLVTRAYESFENQRSPEGEPWAPLSEVTLALRHEKQPKRTRGLTAGWFRPAAGSDQALFVTGRLEESITYKAGDLEVAVGTNAKFPGGTKSRAAIHQLGGQAGRGDKVKIPARPFLGMTAKDGERIAEEFDTYLVRLAAL